MAMVVHVGMHAVLPAWKHYTVLHILIMRNSICAGQWQQARVNGQGLTLNLTGATPVLSHKVVKKLE